ncbi:MAG TPA: hypothetical protein VMA83_11155 [Solirubrobacteraceae bacterium]|nr:hypothetical protein [Solirubrobacteraceae bacterium]
MAACRWGAGAVLVAVLLVLAGVTPPAAAPQPNQGAGRARTAASSGATGGIVEAGARRDDGADEWVLGATALATTRDGGERWTLLSPPTTETGTLTAAVLPRETVAVTVREARRPQLFIYARPAGHSRWRKTTIAIGQPPGPAEVVDDSGRVLGVMDNAFLGSAFSGGTWLAKKGAAWRARRTPVGGSVTAVGGRLWLVGGVVGADVYASANDGRSWRRVRSPLLGPRRTQTVYGAMQAFRGKPVLLAANNAGAIVVYVGSERQGSWSWHGLHRFRPGGCCGTGTDSLAAGTLWVVGASQRVTRISLRSGAAVVTSAQGLPENGQLSLFALGSQTAIAYAVAAGCTDGKSDCYELPELLRTDDGGSTWSPIADPLGGHYEQLAWGSR